MVRATALNVSALILFLATSAAVAQQNATIAPVQDCSRAGLINAIAGIPNTATSAKIITSLNLEYLLPDGKGQGTLLLPKDAAYKTLGVPVETLISELQNQTISIIAYHFLFGQNKTLSRSELIKSSPIKTDLAFLQGNLGQEDKGNYDVTVANGLTKPEGLEYVVGVNPNNTALTRGVVKVCGYYVYPIEGVLIPAATLADVPSGPGAAIKEAMAAGFDLNTPNGLGVATQAESFKFPQQSYDASKSAGDSNPPVPAASSSSAASPSGSAPSPSSDMTTSGGYLPTSAADTDLSPSAGDGEGGMPTSSSAASPDSGSGKKHKSKYGPWRSKKSKATSDGDKSAAQSPDGAMGPGSAMGPGAMGPDSAVAPGELMAPDGAPQAANAPDVGANIVGFLGAAVVQNGTNGSISSKRPIVFQGSMTPKTGSPTEDALVFVNGTVVDGVGVRGRVYPVRQIGNKSIVIDKTMGKAIKGTSFDGMVYNPGKIVPKLLVANIATATAPGSSQTSTQAVAPAVAVVAAGSSAISHTSSAAAILSVVAAVTLYVT